MANEIDNDGNLLQTAYQAVSPMIRYFVILIILLGTWSRCQAIQITNPLPVVDAEVDRFLDDPSFLSAIPNSQLFDFTGVGFGGGWATMISPTHFLSAAHLHPGIGETVTFYDDSGAPIASHEVASGVDCCGGTDLWLGQLATPVDTSIVNVYPVAVGSPTDYMVD